MSVKKKFRMFLRGSVYWVQDNFTRKQESLGVKDRDEAEQLLQARNEAHRQPIINLQIARAYLSVSDPKAATRTWGDRDGGARLAREVHGLLRNGEMIFHSRSGDRQGAERKDCGGEQLKRAAVRRF